MSVDRLVLRAITTQHAACPALKLMGTSNSDTLIGASLLRSAVCRHFSTTNKSGDPDVERSAGATSAPEKELHRTSSPGHQSDTGKKIVTMEGGTYILMKVKDQYYLDVLCGTWAQFSLCIPLDPYEVSLALAGPQSLDALAEKIRYSPHKYAARSINIDRYADSAGNKFPCR